MGQTKSVDIALYGATGYTGGLVASYLVKASLHTPLRLALVGRNRTKLEQVAVQLQREYPAAHPVELIYAESSDEASLRSLAQRSKVIITTVGPYAKYGEPLVKACAEVGADYVDLTGEPAFVDAMIERYHQRAQQQGAKIIHACGFDSIPHDMGAYFTVKTLRRKLSVEEQGSATLKMEGFVRAKGSFSGGTWHSAVNAMAEMRSYEREKRRRARLRVVSGSRTIRNVPPSLRYRKELRCWALPMPTIDPQIVLRSARALPEYGQAFSYGHYVALPHFYQAAGLTVGAGATMLLAQLKPTRDLLLKLKDPGQGPAPEEREKGWFRVTFLASAGEHKVKCEVRGGDPGYGDTAKMLAESALCLALDRNKLPEASGIVTTAEGLGEPLLTRLEAAGIRFAEVS